MNVSRSVLLLASIATTFAAAAEASKLISLADGLTPLVRQFNTQRDRSQFVAILSPT